MVLLTALLASAAVYTLTGPSSAHDRLRRLRQASEPVESAPDADAAGLDLSQPAVRAAVCLVGGGGVAVLVGGWLGILAGVVGAVVGYRLLGGLDSTARRHRSQRLTATLPMAATLLAACLRAGRPIDQAVAAVAVAVHGPLGEELGHVAAALSLGAPPAAAWRRLATEPATAKMARTLVRTCESGAPLAATLDAIATQARADARNLAVQQAKSVGVKAAAPLGLCFLPAFVAVGLVPVIAGVVTNVIHQIL